jgi:Uma2 family endonuclease
MSLPAVGSWPAVVPALEVQMAEPAMHGTKWRTDDLALLPDNGTRYEIIDGELIMSKQPHWHHQLAASRVFAALDAWSVATGRGQAVTAPGVIFGDFDNVIPDVAWVAADRLETILDEAGHLTSAPDLAVEVLSPGPDNEQRDREIKRRLYSLRGVREYWVVDWRRRQVEVFRRQDRQLTLVETLLGGDLVTSPMLPGFAYALPELWGK